MKRKTYREFSREKKRKPRIAAIGTFDGVHYGHQTLIGKARKKAESVGAELIVLTFWPPPAVYLGPEDSQRDDLLTEQDEKAEYLQQLEVDVLVTARFDSHLAKLTPQQFCQQILVQELGLDWVFVGFDFSFGYQGRGTPEKLCALGDELGFRVEVLPPVQLNNTSVSSTLIRRYIRKGEVDAAAQMLKRPYRLDGQVRPGAKRGKELGFPTANIVFSADKVTPKAGVYSVRATVLEKDVKCRPGVAHLGGSPTFSSGDDSVDLVEVHIIGFDGMLYGAQLQCHLIRWLRGNRHFHCLEELSRQIRRDIDKVNKEKQFPPDLRGAVG